jgi:hypothetical protein
MNIATELKDISVEIGRKEEEMRRLGEEVNDLRSRRQRLEDDMDEQHFVSPEPGDFWHEMFTPFFIVLAVENGSVTICEKTKAVYEEPDQNMLLESYENPDDPEVKEYFSRPRKDIGYTFDVGETRTVSRQEFEKMLKCYSFKPDQLTYKCIPGRAKEFVRIWKDRNS